MKKPKRPKNPTRRRAIQALRKRKPAKKPHGAKPIRRKRRAPRTADQYFAKSAQFQERWSRVTHVLSKMRTDGISLTQASREYGIDPRTVALLGFRALRKGANGRFKAKASDHLLRILVIPTPDGLQEVATRDSRQASQIAEYSNAVHKYLETGDDSSLKKFRGFRITDAKGSQVPLITNLDELDRLGSAGVLSFESLYARSS